MVPVIRVVIHVEGGIVQEVFADAPVAVIVVDYDVEGADPEELGQPPYHTISDDPAHVSVEAARPWEDLHEEVRAAAESEYGRALGEGRLG